jgi:hypothetical protein
VPTLSKLRLLENHCSLIRGASSSNCFCEQFIPIDFRVPDINMDDAVEESISFYL